jgi:hypothetical protein
MRPIRTVAAVAALTLAGAGAALAQAAARPQAARTPHPVAGRSDCLSCHGNDANEHVTDVPAAHRFANAACATCHRPAQAMPPASRHAMDAAHTRCAVCHVADSPTGAKPIPDSTHATRHASTCVMCHDQAPPG